MSANRTLEQIEHLALVGIDSRGKDVEVEVQADHGRRPEHPAGRRAKTFDTAPHHGADVVRQSNRW